MSESKSGPFEDAVYILGRYMDNRLRGKEAAIRVLKAAGRAREAKDKYIKNGLSEWGNYMTAIGNLTDVALIEALPDKEEKK